MKKYLSLSISILGSAVSVALIGLLPLQAIAQDYSALNIFGDSLVDSGNIFNLTGFPPSPPYEQKLSNGVVWVEPLADELGLSPVLATEAVPGLLSGTVLPPTEGINFALAGSLSSDINTGGAPLTGLKQQIETFGAIAPALSPQSDKRSDELFVLLAGANDYNQALRTPERLTTSLENLSNQVTDNLTAAASALIDLGAEHLLIPNLPNLGLQPIARQFDQFNPQSSALLTSLSASHNLLLDQKLTALSEGSDTKITQLDLAGLFGAIESDPGSLGFTNIEESCLTDFQSFTTFGPVCDNPDEFVFWDNVHPTSAVHEEIARFAFNALQEKDSPGEAPQSVPDSTGAAGILMVGGAFALYTKMRGAQEQTSQAWRSSALIAKE